MSPIPPIQIQQALTKWDEEAITALFLSAQRKGHLTNCAAFLNKSLTEQEWDALAAAAKQQLPQFAFHHELLLELSSDMDDAVSLAKERMEKINLFLQKQSAQGFLAHELSKKAYKMKTFTYGHVDERMNMNDSHNREIRSLYKSNDEYLAACKQSHDKAERETKEYYDRLHEKEVREKLISDINYRKTYYHHIAIPKEFGARGDYNTGVFELCQANDYDYLYGFDPSALNGWAAMLDTKDLPKKKTIDTEENPALTDLARQYATLKKTPATDRLIEAALGLLPFLYETCPALENCHRNPTQAHTAYLSALHARKPTAPPMIRIVTENPFADIELLQTRTDFPTEQVLEERAKAAKDKVRSDAKSAHFEYTVRPRIMAVFWVLALLDVIAIIGMLAYTYQTATAFPKEVYLIGFVVAVVAFLLCAIFVDGYEDGWKKVALIVLAIVAFLWLGIAADPTALLQNLPETTQ